MWIIGTELQKNQAVQYQSFVLLGHAVRFHSTELLLYLSIRTDVEGSAWALRPSENHGSVVSWDIRDPAANRSAAVDSASVTGVPFSLVSVFIRPMARKRIPSGWNKLVFQSIMIHQFAMISDLLWFLNLQSFFYSRWLLNLQLLLDLQLFFIHCNDKQRCLNNDSSKQMILMQWYLDLQWFWRLAMVSQGKNLPYNLEKNQNIISTKNCSSI